MSSLAAITILGGTPRRRSPRTSSALALPCSSWRDGPRGHPRRPESDRMPLLFEHRQAAYEIAENRRPRKPTQIKKEPPFKPGGPFRFIPADRIGTAVGTRLRDPIGT